MDFRVKKESRFNMIKINSQNIITPLYDTCSVRRKENTVTLRDEFMSSSKIYDFEEEEEYTSPISDFFLRLKIKSKDVPQIYKIADEVTQFARLQQQYGRSLIQTQYNKIEQVVSQTPDLLQDEEETKKHTEYDCCGTQKVTSFTTQNGNIQIKSIEVVNRDGKKDIIFVDENNDVSGVRLGIRQIAPQSYLQDAEITYKNSIISSYFDGITCINDGVVKSKIKTKKNLFKFKDGLISLYSPKVEYIGKDSYSKKVYSFAEGKIKKYVEEYAVENGEKSHKREIKF